MRRRDLLHHTKISKFIEFAETQGYVSEPTKGDCEVLSLRKKLSGMPIVICGYKRDRTDHVTLTGEGIKLFHAMKRSTNQKGNQ